MTTDSSNPASASVRSIDCHFHCHCPPPASPMNQSIPEPSKTNPRNPPANRIAIFFSRSPSSPQIPSLDFPIFTVFDLLRICLVQTPHNDVILAMCVGGSTYSNSYTCTLVHTPVPLPHFRPSADCPANLAASLHFSSASIRSKVAWRWRFALERRKDEQLKQGRGESNRFKLRMEVATCLCSSRRCFGTLFCRCCAATGAVSSSRDGGNQDGTCCTRHKLAQAQVTTG